MNRFISDTSEQAQKKLKKQGKKDASELYADIPEEMLIKEPFTLPEALSEYDLKKVMQNLAGRNISASDAVCFMGAGCYDHFIPATVTKIANAFATKLNSSATADDQSILQGIFEFQELMKSLTGMSKITAENADVTDALRQAIMLAKDVKNGKNIVISRAVNPEYKSVAKTYCNLFGIDLIEASSDYGDTDLKATVTDGTIAVIAQSPNFFGIIENMQKLSEEAHSAKALFIAIVDPISLSILKTPGEYNADIAIGSCQPLGGTLSYGAPFVGFLGTNEALADKITSVTNNGKLEFDGEIGKIQTLQAITAAAYIALMGPKGLKEVAEHCYSNACHTYNKLTATTAFKPLFNKPFFREFAVKAMKKNVNDINNRMLDYGMIGGFALKNEYPEFGNAWLVAVTEKRSADEVELFVKEASRSI